MGDILNQNRSDLGYYTRSALGVRGNDAWEYGDCFIQGLGFCGLYDQFCYYHDKYLVEVSGSNTGTFCYGIPVEEMYGELECTDPTEPGSAECTRVWASAIQMYSAPSDWYQYMLYYNVYNPTGCRWWVGVLGDFGWYARWRTDELFGSPTVCIPSPVGQTYNLYELNCTGFTDCAVLK